MKASLLSPAMGELVSTPGTYQPGQNIPPAHGILELCGIAYYDLFIISIYTTL